MSLLLLLLLLLDFICCIFHSRRVMTHCIIISLWHEV